MTWRVVIRPQVEQDIVEAADWYDHRAPGLGSQFVSEVITVWDALEQNPFLNSRQHPTKNIRWRYPERFPYRIIYEVLENEGIVIVAAVIHAARHDRHWRDRF